MNKIAVTVTTKIIEIFPTLEEGVLMDRKETRKLLKGLEKLESPDPGLETMRCQFRAILQNPTWELISITAPNGDYVRKFGVQIGIHQARPNAQRQRLSPLQKWQRANGLRTR